tara:strand:+ start:281 stop:598 length:318 start_codon:yes stop_codon:yes gene_type:complete
MGDDRYKRIRNKKDKYTRKEYYANAVYPEIPPTSNDIYIVTRLGDRLDILAHNYYGDRALWWVISRANPDKVKRWSYFLDVGIQIRIPSDVTSVVSDFNEINNAR